MAIAYTNKFNNLKKIIGLIMCVALLSACNQGSDKVEPKENASQVQVTGLSLNNGSKWQADSTTSRHVVDLRTIADMFKIHPNPSADEYQILGNDLGNSLSKMIKDCKMTGPDHDALHQWMEPILNESNQLKSSTDTTTARATFTLIDKQLDDYHTYFK